MFTVCSLWFLWPTRAAYAHSPRLTWREISVTNTGNFQKAIAPKTWHFPADFGAHEDYQTEWWYYTGNVETSEGRPFGFQLTFFRQALVSPQPTSEEQSHWRGNQIYSAHFTVSDIENQQFYPYERFSRGAIELAGANDSPYHIWLEDWTATEREPGIVNLQAQTPDVAINLTVQQTLPPVLHGDRGLRIKGPEPGNASYYYSLIQQPTTGSIIIKGQTFAVTGLTWKDHEYATNPLSAGTIGWDWFSAQFNNGSALMLYLLRHEDGSLEPTSAGTFITPDGDTLPLTSADWTVNVLDTWKSPESNATYPDKWLIQIPKLELVLQGQSLMHNQELSTSTATYWEGAVAFQGHWKERLLEGKGYVELTGYVDRLDTLLSATSK
jgi:predicted secreted hydrolase